MSRTLTVRKPESVVGPVYRPLESSPGVSENEQDNGLLLGLLIGDGVRSRLGHQVALVCRQTFNVV